VALLTPEQMNFVRPAPQVSFELDTTHRAVISEMTDETLILQQQLYAQERDFAIAAIAATEEEIQLRKKHGR
jgi:hypothetical protein